MNGTQSRRDSSSCPALFYLCLSSFFVGFSAPSAFGDARIYVLDDKEDSITAISRDGDSLWEVQLEGEPERMAISPGARHIVTLEKGKGYRTEKYGWVPRFEASVNVVEIQSLEVMPLLRVCWSISVGGVERGLGIGGAWYFAPGGERLVILCEGRWAELEGNVYSRKLTPDFPELLEIDLATGTVVRRVTIDRRVTGWINAPDGQGFVIFLPYQEKKGRQPARKAELQFIDGKTLQIETVLQLEGNPSPPLISADQSLLYLLEPGHPTKKEKSNIHGTLYTVSPTTRQMVSSVDVGTAPRVRVDVENAQLVFASDLGPNPSGKKRDTGIIRIIKAGVLVDTFEVGREPIYVESFPKHDRLYTVGARTFTVTDTASGVSHEIEYRNKMTIFGEMVINRDHTRAFLLASPQPQRGFFLNVIDLEKRTMAKPLPVGSTAKFFGKSVAFATVAVGLSGVATSMMPGPQSFADFGSVLARDMAVSTVIQAVVMQGVAGGAYADISFGPDERYVYAINQAVKDVTVFDAKDPGKGTVIPGSGGARRMRLLPESGHMAVLAGDEDLMLVDTSSQTIIEERDFGGNFVFLGDSGDAIALSRNTHSVHLLSAAELNVIRSAGDIKNPYQFVLHPD